MKINKKIVIYSLGCCAFGTIFDVCASLQKKVVSRDPFYLERASSVKKKNKKLQKIEHHSKRVFLEGIMAMGDHLAAALCNGKESEVVVAGDQLWGYTVKDIDRTRVLLVRGDHVIALELD